MLNFSEPEELGDLLLDQRDDKPLPRVLDLDRVVVVANPAAPPLASVLVLGPIFASDRAWT